MKLFIAKRYEVTRVIDFKLFVGVSFVIVEIDLELWSHAAFE